MLRLVLDRPSGPVSAVVPESATCPNCDVPVASTRTPYCGDRCKEIASFVRQLRAGISLGWISDPEKQSALGQNLWFLLGGGRPLRVSIILERSKNEALKRTGGLCQTCGAQATSFDHITTGCNRSINLRPVCASCQKTRDFGDEGVIGNGADLLQELADRVTSADPVRVCDDQATWDWRAYVKGRRS